MGMYVCPSGKIAYITHRMADGSIRDSVEGYEIPYNENTKHLYEMEADRIIAAAKRMAEEARRKGEL